MNRKMLIYGLLGIAATAFIVDRVFLSEPAGAKAQTSALSIPQPSVTAMNRLPKDKALDNAEHPALVRLSQLPDKVGHRNVLTPSHAMRAHLDQQPEVEAERLARAREKEQKKLSLQSFQDAHALQATAITPGAEMAIIDGKLLRIGEKLDGFTLERITPYTATFRQNDAVVELSLPTKP